MLLADHRRSSEEDEKQAESSGSLGDNSRNFRAWAGAESGFWRPRAGEPVRVGDLELAFGGRLLEFEDSSQLLGDPDRLREQLRREGYVFLRGVLDKALVAQARQVVTNCLLKDFERIDLESGCLDDARIKAGKKGTLLTGYRPVCDHADIQALACSDNLTSMFRRIFLGEDPATLTGKWVRVFGTDESTDEHTDYYRFSSSAEELFTCWAPLGDYDINQGVLAVCPGSHLFIDPEGGDDGQGSEEDDSDDGKEWEELPGGYTRRRDQLSWRTGLVRAGDVIVFDIRLVHASTANLSGCFRLSMDTRWKPARLVNPNAQEAFTLFSQRSEQDK